MTGDQQPPAKKSPNEGARNPKGGRRERGTSGGGFWYLLILGILGAVLFSVLSRSWQGERMEYSDFLRKIRSGELPKERVCQLQFSEAYLTWQDHSREEILANRNLSWKSYYTPLLSASEQAREDLRKELAAKEIPYGFDEPAGEWRRWFPSWQPQRCSSVVSSSSSDVWVERGLRCPSDAAAADSMLRTTSR
ncbi:MAG UNVERIFIED_CONTAM: hypothetical protein LVR18_14620 [Planctomycetaceae bacterium]|jgi:hypothetical protein